MSHFDSSSGLVYTEKTSDRVGSMIPKWTTHSRGKRKNPMIYLHKGSGCSSLHSMALRACVWNVDDMEPGALQWLGWHYASRLYDELKKKDTLSFHTWSIFLKAFPEHIDRHTAFRYNEEEKKYGTTAPSQLPSMINRLAKLDVSALTFLSVRNFVLNFDHLIALTKIDSLAVLTLERPMLSRASVDDAISTKDVLNWGRSVRESGAFQKLKVLAFGNLGPESTKSTVLKAASDFPALTLVGIFNEWAKYSGQLDHVMKHLYGSWYPTPAEDDDAGLHASSIWMDRTTTKAQKMQQIYDHSHELSRKSRTESNPYHSVSMSYSHGQEPHSHVEESKVAWFQRELEQNATYSTTHPGIEDGPKEKSNVREGSHHKKRKVREGKGIDVGSLLGSFT